MPEEVMESSVDASSESAPSFEDLLTENMREHGGSVDDEELESINSELEEDAGLVDLDAADDEVADEGPRGASERVRKPGIDKILTHLDQELPGAGEVVRGMQSETSRVINEFNDLKGQMLDVMVEMREGTREDSDGEDVAEEEDPGAEFEPSEIQLKRIERAASRLGFVRKAEVEAEKAEDESRSYVDDAMKEGVKKYGVAFGTMDGDGKPVLNPAIRDKLKPVRDRLASKGFTPLDLAVLSGVLTPEEAEARREEEGREASPRQRTRPRRANRANVADGSLSGSSTMPSIRSKSPENDDPSDVFDRAFLLGRKKLRRTRK